MTRIIGGSARGRSLRTPSGKATRPTTDRVREALFSSLEATLGTLRGVAFLDVYAGSGAVGLEAASRGAAWVTFVERDRSVSALISANARALGLASVSVFSGAASTLPPTPAPRLFDVAFFDPPYDVPAEALTPLLTALGEHGWLAPRAQLVVERSRRSGPWLWPAGIEPVRDRRYGDTVLWYGRFDPPRDATAVPASSEEDV